MAQYLQLGDLFAGNAGASAAPGSSQTVSTNAASAGYQPQTSQQLADARNQFNVLKEQADRDYSLRKRELDQQANIAKQNAKSQQERNAIDKWYNEQQVALAGQRLAQEGRIADERLAFDKQTQAQNFGLAQAKQGYDLLSMASQLRGPASYFQAANFNRGVANDPNSATFLNALKNNVRMPDFAAPGGVPDAETLGTLSAKLGTPLQARGQPAVGAIGQTAPTGAGNADDAYLGQIRAIGAAGAQKLGAGSLEGLTDTERKLLMSGLDANGFDTPSFLDAYRRSRINQGVGNVSAA